jgi:hypothetical protein
MNINKQGSTSIREFSSIGEFLSYINNTPRNGHFGEESKYNDYSFAGTHSYDEAVDLITHGWTEASKKMQHHIELMPSPAKTNRTKSVYSVSGHTASVPRYLQGIPTNMISSQPDIRKTPVVTITHSIAYNCSWTTESILEQGIKVLEIIRALESRMYNVRLNILCASQCGNETSGFKVCIKQPGERLNISKMAFPLAHPSMLRRFFFKYLEVSPDPTRRYFGYGTPAASQVESNLYPKEMFIPEQVDVEKFLKKFL